MVQSLVKLYLEITTGGKIGQRNFERGLLARKDGIGAEFNWANVEKGSIRFREERVWLGDERIRLGQKKRV